MEDEKMGSTRSPVNDGTKWCDPWGGSTLAPLCKCDAGTSQRGSCPHRSYRPDFFPAKAVMPMECQIEANKKQCNCTYDPCPRKGICCECITYHRAQNQLPACYFPKDSEKTYDRSVEKFLSLHLQKKR